MKRITVNAGDRYGRLTIVEELPEYVNKSGRPLRRFSCLCDCGKRKEASLQDIRQKQTTSCGCARGTHRSHGTPEYQTWSEMKCRCLNPSSMKYKYYGGRGIDVCERWKNSFENFYADMGPKPSKEHSLDRIDNNKGYSPDNCRWATKIEQAGNKRNTRYLTHNGRRMCVSAWARELGKNRSTLFNQIKRVGEENVLKLYLD